MSICGSLDVLTVCFVCPWGLAGGGLAVRWRYSIVGLLVDWLRWSAVADGKLGISQRGNLGFGFLGLGLAQETQNLGRLGFSL